MAETTGIEWTEATWNPITGCSLASPGCTNCYAMQLAGTRLQHHWSRKGLTRESGGRPKWTGEVRFNEEWLTQPLKWKRPRMIFVCAHGDLFHESVPDEWIDRVFAVMALAPHHTFQVLTKRSARMREYFAAKTEIRPPFNGSDQFPRAAGHVERWANLIGMNHEIDLPWRPRHSSGGYWWGFKADLPWPLPNVWLGVSAEDQARADERIPDLLATPAAARWLSCEPLLGPLSLEEAWHGENALYSECWGDCAWCEKGHPPLHNCQQGRQSGEEIERNRSGLDWIVAGGESGPGARPMHPDWARSLRDQCQAAGVPFFFKQWGEWSPIESWEPWDRKTQRAIRFDGTPMPGEDWFDDGQRFKLVGKKRAGRLLDGREWNGMPNYG